MAYPRDPKSLPWTSPGQSLALFHSFTVKPAPKAVSSDASAAGSGDLAASGLVLEDLGRSESCTTAGGGRFHW